MLVRGSAIRYKDREEEEAKKRSEKKRAGVRDERERGYIKNVHRY